MNSLYRMAIDLTMTVTGMTAGATLALQHMQRLQHQAGLTATQVDKLGAALRTFAAGAAVTGVGVALVGFMDKAVNRAMALQTIMVGLQQRTGAALIDPRTQGFTAQGQRLSGLFTSIGQTNQMSTGEVAGVAQSASRAGITNIAQLQNMLRPLANYSEIMLRATGANVSDSARIATEFAHLYGAFGDKTVRDPQSGKSMSDTAYMVNALGKAMQIVPGSQDDFLRMMSQYVGVMRVAYRGQPEQRLISDSMNYGVLMSQMGQQTRGGTQLARLIVQEMGAGSRTSKAGRAALADIQRVSGVHFANAQGQINDPVMMMRALTGFAASPGVTPQREMTEFQAAFKVAGAGLAGLLADPGVAHRFQVIADAMKAMPNIDAQQRQYNASPAGQFNQARKNWDSAMTTLGILWLPLATQAANALASFTSGLIRFTQQHPKLMQFGATFVAVTAVVALVVGPLLMLAGAVLAISAIIGAPAIAVFLALFAAITGISLIITHWSEVVRMATGAMHGLLRLLGLVHDPSSTAAVTQTAAAQNAARTTFTTPTHDIHGHPIPGGGRTHTSVHSTPTPGGTIGLAPVVPVTTIAPPHHDLNWWKKHGVGGGGGAAYPGAHAPTTTGPITIGPIHVHPSAGMDEEALAKRTVAMVAAELAEAVIHTMSTGASGGHTLAPSLRMTR